MYVIKDYLDKIAELRQLDQLPAGRTDELIQLSIGIDSNPICMAVVTIKGAKPGPKLWVQAQTHGDETNSTEAILRVLRGIDYQDVCGTLVFAPAMNSTAVRHMNRESLIDGKNGNRIWNTDWSQLGFTRVFSYIWMQRVEELVMALHPDLFIDMHDGGRPLNIMSHVLYEIGQLAYAPHVHDLAVKSNMEVMWRYTGGRFNGSTDSFCAKNRLPNLMLESGGTGILVEEDIQQMAVGLRNVLIAGGHLPGSPAIQNPGEQLVMVRSNWVRGMKGGLFYPLATCHERVRKGQKIAEIGDNFGHIIEEIFSPADGIIFGVRCVATADMGNYLFNVGELEG